MRARLSVLVFTAFMWATPAAHALKQPLGPEFNISNPSAENTEGAAVAADSHTGRYLIVWRNPGLTARLVDRDGRPLTDEFTVSDDQPYFADPVVAYNAGLHEYLVVWHRYQVSAANELRVQRVSASGAKIGDSIAGWPAHPNQVSVACSSSGSCLVAWTGFGVHAGMIGPGGAPATPEIPLAPSGGQIRRAGQSGPAVAYAPAVDRYLVVWGDLGAVSGRMFDGGGGQIGSCCGIVSAGFSPLLAYNSRERQFGVLFSSAYQLAGARILENGDHSVDGIIAPGTAYGASFAFDSHDDSYLAVWPGQNGDNGGASFLTPDLTSVAPADFAVGYVVTYNAAADEYLLVRPSCTQPGGLQAVCGRRVGNPPAAADRTGPRLRLTVRRLQRVVRQRGLVLRARCDEACTVRASARIALPGASSSVALRPVTRSLAANARTKLKLKTSKRELRKLRRALRTRHRLGARLTVTAADSSRNRTIAKRKLRARR